MFKETLEELGLSPNEAKIYEGLIRYGQASVPDISAKIGVHKRNIYDTVPRLLQKGLIYQIAGKESLYAAVAPDKLNDLVWEKEAKLKSILPGLTQQYKKTTSHEAVYIYKGIEGFKNYLRDILDIGEDVYFVGAKGGWFDKELQPFIYSIMT
ncbi:MAG: hypothetical protein KW804_02945 [Candidatus Doudnabacteria bacterium]|nr:hypothetical protein [Candidatus Doudnabacteria bacterium]